MTGKLPGTEIEAFGKSARDTLTPAFLSGGLVLSQVEKLSGIKPYTVQNWIKRGFCSPPKNKQYTLRQFCRLVIINTFKDILPLDSIVKALSYINYTLDDESDDLIPDDELYFLFNDAVLMLWDKKVDSENVKQVCRKLSKSHEECAEKLENVLFIMVNSYFSELLRKSAEDAINNL